VKTTARKPLSSSTENDLQDDVSIIPITFSLKLIHPVEMGEVYIGGGLGIYFVVAEADINSTGFGNPSFGDNDNIFGVHLFVGMDFTIHGNWFLGIEGKYLITQESEITDNFYD
jgi:opacity protein-like surface antigen